MDEGWTAECGESFMIETRLRGMSSNRAVASKIPAANPPPSKASYGHYPAPPPPPPPKCAARATRPVSHAGNPNSSTSGVPAMPLIDGPGPGYVGWQDARSYNVHDHRHADRCIAAASGCPATSTVSHGTSAT
ncbi:hypothetical protein CTAM01_06230 [Colletotrichum tamarilloi]|uniref:Uncharacterized protein n=1 Tax=Colletotrichum tamarilloi TaxID=1209934 RepID=A0ABQ9RC35_9PEZI|nr:uncharacterized protein CTAM01_06230 [Colletotrichum tamarilloi]KAK1500778.1 hypothetical protein CTAM01_06230 [Colletotrichum tamarilloi]